MSYQDRSLAAMSLAEYGLWGRRTFLLMKWTLNDSLNLVGGIIFVDNLDHTNHQLETNFLGTCEVSEWIGSIFWDSFSLTLQMVPTRLLSQRTFSHYFYLETVCVCLVFHFHPIWTQQNIFNFFLYFEIFHDFSTINFHLHHMISTLKLMNGIL